MCKLDDNQLQQALDDKDGKTFNHLLFDLDDDYDRGELIAQTCNHLMGEYNVTNWPTNILDVGFAQVNKSLRDSYRYGLYRRNNLEEAHFVFHEFVEDTTTILEEYGIEMETPSN